MNFKDFAESYLSERVFAHSTEVNYRSILNAHLLPAFGEQEVSSITVKDVRTFQKELLAKVAGSRVNTICQLLKCILSEAKIDVEVKKVRQARTKVEPFTPEEISKIFAVVDPHFLPLFHTLLSTGMRPNEAFALTWDDINFEDKTINIDKGMVAGVAGNTKTESSERVIPMMDSLAQILLPLKASGLVFKSKSGVEIKGDIARVWKRALLKAGVKYRPPYSLRHTMITTAIMKGINISYVSRLAGHSNIGTTLLFYARWVNSTEHEDKFRALMG